MVLLRLVISAACMGYVPLPVLLTVKSFVLYLPAFPSCSPQFFLHLRTFCKYRFSCNTLYYLYDLLWAILWYGLYQEMYMISICPYFQKSYFISFFYFLTRLFYYFIYLIIYYYSSIFCWTYEVIHKHWYIVRFVYILTHLTIPFFFPLVYHFFHFSQKFVTQQSCGELDPERLKRDLCTSRYTKNKSLH